MGDAASRVPAPAEDRPRVSEPALTRTDANIRNLTDEDVKEWGPLIERWLKYQTSSNLSLDLNELRSRAYGVLANVKAAYNPNRNTSFSTLLSSSLNNMFSSYIREIKKRDETSLNEPDENGSTPEEKIAAPAAAGVALAAPDPEYDLRLKEAEANLAAWVKTLDERDRKIFGMIRAGKKNVEIARELGITPERARQLRNRIRAAVEYAVLKQEVMYQPAAALRSDFDPNTAGEPGQLRDGNVPHAPGFLEWAELKGTRLYADYEFLYGRHSQYFSSQEMARAAVELVLANPEKVQDKDGNRSFVGFDAETGSIYRIEIDPVVKNKANHIRSVFEISPTQYEKIKLAESPVLQLSPTEGTGQSAGRTIASFMERNIQHQSEKSSKVRGAFAPAEDFRTSFRALILLMQGAADASTMPHEFAHWTKRMMESMVASGHADEQLTAEMDTVNKWLDRQTYTAKEGTAAYIMEREYFKLKIFQLPENSCVKVL